MKITMTFLLLIATLVIGKINAQIPNLTFNCPSDITVDCIDVDNLSQYGEAEWCNTVTGQCIPVANVVVFNDLNHCGLGSLKRLWQTTDLSGNPISCLQKIQSNYNSMAPSIIWPRDYTITSCDGQSNSNVISIYELDPLFWEEDCQNHEVCKHEAVVTYNPSCQQIHCKWEILDTCHPNPTPGNGFYSHTQVITIEYVDEPTVDSPRTIDILADNCDGAYVTLDELNVGLYCPTNNYIINHDSPYADTTGTNASGFYPIGTHTVTYGILYGCYSHHTFKQRITVNPLEGVVAQCVDSAQVVLTNQIINGSETVFAEIKGSSLNDGSIQNCAPNENLWFSFSDEIRDDTLSFSCDDIGTQLVTLWVTNAAGQNTTCNVVLTVTDGGSTLCSPDDDTSGDNGDNDTDEDEDADDDADEDLESYTAMGSIQKYHNGAGVENATASLTRTLPNIIEYTISDSVLTEVVVDSFYSHWSSAWTYIIDEQLVVTDSVVYESIFPQQINLSDSMGNYAFAEVDNTFEYTLDVAFGDEPDDFDYAANADYLQQYLDGTLDQSLVTPYFILTADVDDNQVIDSTDVNALRQMADGSIAELPTENDWIIVAASYEFADPNAPFTDASMSEVLITHTQVSSEIIEDYYIIQKGNFGAISDAAENNFGALTNKDNTPKQSYDIYPNPAQAIINVTIDDIPESGNTTISIFNTKGQLIKALPTGLHKGANHISLDVNDLQSGVYFVQMMIGNELASRKFLKM